MNSSFNGPDADEEQIYQQILQFQREERKKEEKRKKKLQESKNKEASNSSGAETSSELMQVESSESL